jgi:hypothetical protein
VLSEGPGLPAPVATLDELLLIVRRDSPLRFDPELGFHLYGADLCFQARERGLAVVALGEPCRHRSRSVGLPRAFFASAKVPRGARAARERPGGDAGAMIPTRARVRRADLASLADGWTAPGRGDAHEACDITGAWDSECQSKGMRSSRVWSLIARPLLRNVSRTVSTASWAVRTSG